MSRQIGPLSVVP